MSACLLMPRSSASRSSISSICSGKSTLTRFVAGCSTSAFFSSNPSDSRSSPASNRSVSSFSVLGYVFFIEFPVAAARFPNRDDSDVRFAVGVNGGPQIAVTMHSYPRITDLSSTIASDDHCPHLPQFLCFTETDPVLELIARAFIWIELKIHPSTVYLIYLNSIFWALLGCGPFSHGR